ncbi:MAG: heme ABC transporter ATP-binding protein [Anaerolineae bacterium]|nr:heme ABC transporter ATP-binding protein [Anaerolineae bacterium]
MAVLVLENLSYHINGKALLDGVSLELAAGEVLALVGPNGAGKSTLLRLLGGEWQPSQGTITFLGRPLSRYRRQELARLRGVMAQRAELAFEFTAQEVVMMGRYPHQGWSTSNTDRQIVEAALTRTEAWHLRERLFATLSGGEAARVTLARVLAQQPRLFLLDEPTAALDLRHQQLVMMIARELAAEGRGVLVVLHDINLAAQYADRVGIVHDGRLAVLGDPWKVLAASNIEAAFDLPVLVQPHPAHAGPLIVPLAPTR